MLSKCPIDICEYPNCPEGKICDTPFPQLLENVIKERNDLITFKNTIQNILNHNRDNTIDADTDACPFGCFYCIHNPEYERQYYYDDWKKDGFPMKCWYIEEGQIDPSKYFRCPRYDCEDK